LRILVLEENDHVARLAIFRNQEASPKFAFQGILKTFRPSGQTFDCADFVDRFKLLGEALDSTEVSRGGNILGSYCHNKLRLRREALFNLFRLANTGIAG